MADKFEPIEQSLEMFIENTRQMGIIVSDFQPQGQQVLNQKLQTLINGMQEIDKLKQQVHDVQVPMEVFDYIDQGKNPNLYTKDCLEKALSKNEQVKGKIESLKDTKSRKPPMTRKSTTPAEPSAPPPTTPHTASNIAQIIQSDHKYHVSDSPRKLKRRLDDTVNKMEVAKKRLKYARQKNRRLLKRVESLSCIVKSLKEKGLVSEKCSEMLNSTFSDIPADLMKRMLDNNTRGKITRETYPATLRSFALTLNFYSAKAYKYVRKTFDLALPHVSVIRKWYSSINGQPGFTEEAFTTLSMKVEAAKENNTKVVCSLMIDEMSIRKFVKFDGKQFVGYVDLGTQIEDDNTPLATEVLVFMLVAVNGSWKLPVAYFLIHGMSGIERANLIRQCLQKAYDIGVTIVSLTCDGPSCHFTMCDDLGAKLKLPDLKPHFNHPSDSSQKIVIILDICHMLKLVRNNLASAGSFKDPEGNEVRWSLIRELHALQTKEGLLAGNKLKSAHINWEKQKMKVNLAVQTLSSSVADALEFCRDDLKLKAFQDSAPTVKFIRIFDRLFDLMNSRNPFARYYKAPMKSTNEAYWRPFVTDAYTYISGITDMEGRPITDTKRKTPFIGFLVGITSFQMLYDRLVGCESPTLKYLLTYKMSQDHLELFFGAVRSAGGANNNPTACQFKSIYKRLLVRHEIKSSTGNCLAMDNTSILHVPSTAAHQPSPQHESDNLLIRKYDLELLAPMDNDHDYVDAPNISPLSDYKQAVIPYIAGFVVRMAIKRTPCDLCRVALSTGEQMDATLLSRKDRGGLIKPSRDVVTICEATETCTQRLLIATDGKLPQAKGIAQAMITAVLSEVAFSDVFAELSQHMLDTGPETNHVYILIKLVASCYIKIRFHKLARDFTSDTTGNKIRKNLSKLILFNHQ